MGAARDPLPTTLRRCWIRRRRRSVAQHRSRRSLGDGNDLVDDVDQGPGGVDDVGAVAPVQLACGLVPAEHGVEFFRELAERVSSPGREPASNCVVIDRQAHHALPSVVRLPDLGRCEGPPPGIPSRAPSWRDITRARGDATRSTEQCRLGVGRGDRQFGPTCRQAPHEYPVTAPSVRWPSGQPNVLAQPSSETKILSRGELRRPACSEPCTHDPHRYCNDRDRYQHVPPQNLSYSGYNWRWGSRHPQGGHGRDVTARHARTVRPAPGGRCHSRVAEGVRY